MANAPLMSMDDPVRYCLLPMHDTRGGICMGRTMDFVIRPTLRRMVDAVQTAYWSGGWFNAGLVRKFSFRGQHVSSLGEWAELTKKYKNLASEVNWLDMDGVTLRRAIGSHTWIGKFTPMEA